MRHSTKLVIPRGQFVEWVVMQTGNGPIRVRVELNLEGALDTQVRHMVNKILLRPRGQRGARAANGMLWVAVENR